MRRSRAAHALHEGLAPHCMLHAPTAQVVTLGNEVHRIKVKPGPEGMREFQATIRQLFNIPGEP
jgi:hypothetical protein